MTARAWRARHATRAQQRAQTEAATAAHEQAVAAWLGDPAHALDDATWSRAPRTGNPVAVADCGGHHDGACYDDGGGCERGPTWWDPPSPTPQ